MSLPLYKIIEVYDANQTSLWARLANAPIGSQPVALDLSRLESKEREALKSVEEFLAKTRTRSFPYPLYVVSNVSDYKGDLDLFPSLETLPVFYKKKNRPLNMKENTLMAKVALKQKSLENINMDEIKPVISLYGRNHKMIFKKQSYLDFLSEIQAGLRGKK